MYSQVGKDRLFRSFRQWATKADLTPSRAGQVAEQGTAMPDTVLRLGKAAGKSGREMFVIAGWWSDEPDPEGLRPKDRRLLAAFGTADQSVKEMLLRGLGLESDLEEWTR